MGKGCPLETTLKRHVQMLEVPCQPGAVPSRTLAAQAGKPRDESEDRAGRRILAATAVYLGPVTRIPQGLRVQVVNPGSNETLYLSSRFKVCQLQVRVDGKGAVVFWKIADWGGGK